MSQLIKITSPAFAQGAMIPKQYSCDGAAINPPLNFSNIPQDAKSLVLIVDDPDAPMATFTHWLVWNISPQTLEIKENSLPQKAIEGTNTGGTTKYVSPCPPSGQHRYFFKIYALNTVLDLPSNTNKASLEQALSGHIIASGELMGIYKRG